jgi:hypothetical protein
VVGVIRGWRLFRGGGSCRHNRSSSRNSETTLPQLHTPSRRRSESVTFSMTDPIRPECAPLCPARDYIADSEQRLLQYSVRQFFSYLDGAVEQTQLCETLSFRLALIRPSWNSHSLRLWFNNHRHTMDTVIPAGDPLGILADPASIPPPPPPRISPAAPSSGILARGPSDTFGPTEFATLFPSPSPLAAAAKSPTLSQLTPSPALHPGIYGARCSHREVRCHRPPKLGM